jgi:P4 family phage/plasmid primase-like protien
MYNGGDPEEPATVGDSPRVGVETTETDIKLAYRLACECISPERRAGEYQDWINLAICLKNIANNEDSFKVWVDVTRRVDAHHKKAKMTDSELRTKWGLIRVDASKKLSMPSLVHWAKEDNPKTCHSIHSEFLTRFIIGYAKDTHVSIAAIVCETFKNEFRCSMGAKRGAFLWYQYATGSHAWKMLRTPTVLRAHISGRIKSEFVVANTQLNNLWGAATEDAEKERIDAKRKILFKIERELEMTIFKDHVMKECQERFYDEEFLDRMNSNPYIVGVANGVLELRHYDNEEMTGRPRVHFRAGRPDDCISFQMGHCDPDLDPISYHPYDPALPEQRDIAEFFRKIYPDEVLREYVLTLLSSCLEGKNAEQKFYVMQGPGSNGKSMIEILMESAFGDYGTSMSTTVLTRKKPDSGSANPDIITVKNRRYIHTGEPDDNEKINTAIMKQYSGGDRVPARALFSEQEKFVISGKIFMSCNDLPPVSKMDGGTWRRIRVIPHVSIFKDAGDPLINPAKHIHEKDLDLENKLRHWRTAFLSLLVHYYDTKYLVHGLREPPCVSAASNKYKEENDVFMTFFNENFVKEVGAGPILAAQVKSIWREWKKQNLNGRMLEIKEHQVFERMKETCGSGSTEKEFFCVRQATETDLSGAALLTPVTGTVT